jgi:hypothetical protein
LPLFPLQDAPITIDSDDEPDQQQGAAAAAAAAGDVEHMVLSSDGEGPSGGSRRRRSSRINLLDPEPGTAAKFAVSGRGPGLLAHAAQAN